MSPRTGILKPFVFALLCVSICLSLPGSGSAQQARQAAYKAEKPVRSTMLPRATPESKGVSSLYILDMLQELEKRNYPVHSMVIAVDGAVIFDGYWNPYNPDTPYVTFSLSKLFANTAAGIAVTNGKLKLTDKVVDYFPDRVPANANENLKAMTVRDLITMRSGHAREISGNEWRPLKTSWIDAFMKEPVPHKPGTHYQYSSGNTFMLSAMVQKATGQTCEDLLKSALLPKLGIRQFSWDKSPEGITSGYGGVMITTEDMLKIGMLYEQRGMWNGERLLTEEWCDLSMGHKDAYPGMRNRYAFHWSDRGGVYTAGGRFGQSVLIFPELKMVVSITAGTASRRYQAEYSAILREKIVDRIQADGDRKYDGKYAPALQNKAASLNVLPVARVTDSPLAEKLNGKTFAVAQNPDGISEIGLNFAKGSVTFTMKDARGMHTVVNGVGCWLPSRTTMTGNYLHHQYQNPSHPVVASAQWTDDNTLQLTWRFTDMPFCDYVTLKLTDNTLSMVRSVNVNSTGPFGGQVRPEVKGTLR